MANSKHEYKSAPVQFDQTLYLERLERLADLFEENNVLLKQLVKAQEPAKEETKPAAKASTTAKKETAPKEEKDAPAEDKKGD